MNTSFSVTERLDGFSGADLSTPCGKDYCRLENFRVLADGSIQKREGSYIIASLPGEIRGIRSFHDGGEEVLLAVSSDRLYRIDMLGGVTSSAVFETTVGKINFLPYRDKLYLLDGKRIYRYDGGANAVAVEGYTPLYGKGWSCEYGHNTPVYEPVNLLWRCVRLEYDIGAEIESIYIGIRVKSVVHLFADGTWLDDIGFTLSEDGCELYFTEINYFGILELTVVPDDMYYGALDITSAMLGAVYDDFDHSRILLYGGRDSSCVFVSKPLSEDMRKQDAERFPLSEGLYFPPEGAMNFGGGQTLTAVTRLYDRILLMFSTSLWASEPMLDTRSGFPRFSPICGHIGCSSYGGTVITGAASPLVVAASGIWRLRFDSYFEKECVAECLSSGIFGELSASFLSHARICYHRRLGELWFYDPTSIDGRVWIYQIERGQWQCFILPIRGDLFEYGGEVGFCRDGDIFLLDEALVCDGDDGEIVARFDGSLLGLSEPDACKSLERITLLAEIAGGELSLSLADGGKLVETWLLPTDEAPIGSFVHLFRVSTARFYTARPAIVAKGGGRQRIYALEFKGKKGKE